MDQLADFDLAVQPMVHVADMATSIAFYETLGAAIVFGSRRRLGVAPVRRHAPQRTCQAIER